MDWPALGSIGHVVSDLSPSGTVQVNGSRYPARAEQANITAGSQVVVSGFDRFSLFVREARGEEATSQAAEPAGAGVGALSLFPAKAGPSAPEAGGPLHGAARPPEAPGWDTVRFGLGLIFRGTCLGVAAGGSLAVLALLTGAKALPPELGLPVLVLSIALLVLLVVAWLMPFVGALLCCAVPREAGVRGWAWAWVGLQVAGGALAALNYLSGPPGAQRAYFQGEWLAPDILLALVGLVTSFSFMMLMRGIALFWNDPDLGGNFVAFFIVTTFILFPVFAFLTMAGIVVWALPCGAVVLLWFLLLMSRLSAACSPTKGQEA